MADSIDQYSKSHQHPVNRLLHALGLPTIVVAIILATVGLAGTPSLLPYTAGVFVVGWIFQFVGHAFEGKAPEFFKDWRFLFVGLRWWFAKISGCA